MLKMLNIITPSYGHQANASRASRSAGKMHANHDRIRVRGANSVTRTRGNENKEEFDVKHSDVLKGYDPGQYSGYKGINLKGGINLSQATDPVGTRFMPIYGFTGMGTTGGVVNIYA